MSSTASNHRNETAIVADPALPSIVITREFDAPPERVFRAHVDPDLVSQWLGPRDLTMQIATWDARTGGSWRYAAVRNGEEVASFYGSFHELRPNERIVQTFTYEGVPDAVSLEILTLEDLGGRTRLVATSVGESIEARDAALASGMEQGIREGYEKLDELLA
jgi:uncharacterized protein YndB with AHSA1/START domain